MALKAYIGTSSSADEKSTKIIKLLGNKNEGDGCSKQKLEPIKRDPILEMKYNEAIKPYLQRGKVNFNKTIVRQNRKGENVKKHRRGELFRRVTSNVLRNRNDSVEDIEEEEDRSSMSQRVYKSSVKRLKARMTSAIYEGLAQETLSIKYHQLGPDGLQAACIALVSNTAVSTVDFTSTDAGRIGAQYVADVLRENLYILDLTLAENDIGSEGLTAICDALKENRTLRYLNLSGNGFRENDAMIIREMMGENTTLKLLDLSHNQFRDEGGVYLAEGIESNDALEDLDLSWNHLRQRGAKSVIEALHANTTIKRVDLSFNGFHDAADELEIMLAEEKTLTYLDLTSNRLTDRDMEKIIKGFGKNVSLESLLIGKNPYTASYCYQLLQAVYDNPNSKIKEIDLENQPVELDLLDLIQKVREQRQLYIRHGILLKADLQKEASDDFENADPIMVLMECIAQREIKLIDLFRKIDRDDSKTITKTELREGLQSLNIPMSAKAIDKLMKSLDVDDDGVIDFAELMEGQREYYRRKQLLDAGEVPRGFEDSSKMKEKVAKLMKMRKLAKMAQVLDSSTEQMKRVINMSKDNPKKYYQPGFVDKDSVTMERIAQSAFSVLPKTPEPLNKSQSSVTFEDV